MNNDTAHTEGISMLCSVVLNYAFKAIKLEITVASITKEKLLLKMLCQRFYLAVKDPFHIFENQFSSRRPIWVVKLHRSASGANGGILLSYVSVESLPNV